MRSTTLTMSSSRLEKRRRDSCRRLSASCWRRGMKSCSVLGSSELPSVSLSKAEHSSIPSSTFQPFDECILPLVAPLQLKGCTRTPSLCSSTTPSGASERRHCLCLCSPLRLRGRTGVFRRREGPASLPFSRASPSPCSSSLSSVRGFFSSRGWPPADPFGIRPPFVLMYVIVVELSYVAGSTSTGASGRVFLGAAVYLLASPRFSPKSTVTAEYLNADSVHACRTFPGMKCSEGIVGSTFLGWVQHGSRCVYVLGSPLLHSTILGDFIPVLRVVPSMAWGSTVYGVAGLVFQFEARKVGQWMLAHWFVLSGIHSLEPTKTGQAIPGVSVARSVLMDYFPVHIKGRSGLRIPAEFGARIFKPLGSSGALREPQDHQRSSTR